MELQLSLKQMISYLFSLNFYVLLKLDKKSNFWKDLEHFSKNATNFWILQVLIVSKKWLLLLHFNLYFIENRREVTYRFCKTTPIHFLQNWRYLMLLWQKGAISIKNHQFFHFGQNKWCFWTKIKALFQHY